MRISEWSSDVCSSDLHFDAARAHGIDEGHMLDARLLHPDDVVEQQLIVVRWGQACQRRSGTMDENAAKLSDFRVHTVGDRHDVSCQEMRATTLRHAMMMTVRIKSSGHMKASHRS